ncbi:MAG: minor capsid protein [Roseburia sp.]|nr:minor capsid protein [Roseburia sp.]
MRNDAYWANRMRILEESLLDTGYDYVKNLEQQYDSAIRAVESQISVWYQRFAAENGITLAEARKLLTTQELREFQWTVEEYIKHGQENAVSQAWLKQLKNASARVHVSRLDSLKLQLQQQAETLHGTQTEALTSSLAELYERGYYHTAFEIQKGVGVGWSLHSLTDDQIKKVLSRPWTLDGQTFSDRIWKNKQSLVNTVNTQLTQMIMRGSAPDKAIKAISDRFKVSKSQAGRLVMTETAAFANEARKDCFKDLGVEKYVVVETLDGETCDLCGQLDGKVYPMSEYAVGVTAPPFHPWCRGTTAPYYEDLEGLGVRAARDEEGKYYEVPKGMTYSQWAKKSGISTEVSKKPFTPGSERGIMQGRNMAMGLRQPASRILTEEEISSIKADAEALGIDPAVLRFNTGDRTGFSDARGDISICGDILPDLDSKIARDQMSQRAVLAHEYYGHLAHHPSEYPIGDWRDEFRASYDAAVNAPGLSDEDRALLMIDAYDRAHEAGEILNYDETARRIIYGF